VGERITGQPELGCGVVLDEEGNMHRLRTAILAIWYGLVLNRFSIRDGNLYIPAKAIVLGDTKNNVTRISLDHARREPDPGRIGVARLARFLPGDGVERGN
jgi:hypothetical protein